MSCSAGPTVPMGRINTGQQPHASPPDDEPDDPIPNCRPSALPDLRPHHHANQKSESGRGRFNPNTCVQEVRAEEAQGACLIRRRRKGHQERTPVEEECPCACVGVLTCHYPRSAALHVHWFVAAEDGDGGGRPSVSSGGGAHY